MVTNAVLCVSLGSTLTCQKLELISNALKYLLPDSSSKIHVSSILGKGKLSATVILLSFLKSTHYVGEKKMGKVQSYFTLKALIR